MPLIRSMTPKAFEKNVKAEIKAGKPPKQAVAIAYDIKRDAAAGVKKTAALLKKPKSKK